MNVLGSRARAAVLRSMQEQSKAPARSVGRGTLFEALQVVRRDDPGRYRGRSQQR